MKDDGINYKINAPKLFRECYCIEVSTKSGYTRQLMQYIIDDSLTSKSFYSVCEGLKSFRTKEYEDRKNKYLFQIEYYSTILSHQYQLTKDKTAFEDAINKIPIFCKVKDPLGYNELHRLSDNYVIMLFEKLVTTAKN